jgi:hypothetical protein
MVHIQGNTSFSLELINGPNKLRVFVNCKPFQASVMYYSTLFGPFIRSEENKVLSKQLLVRVLLFVAHTYIVGVLRFEHTFLNLQLRQYYFFSVFPKCIVHTNQMGFL